MGLKTGVFGMRQEQKVPSTLRLARIGVVSTGYMKEGSELEGSHLNVRTLEHTLIIL
jgi:hypothetical protein